MNKQQINKQVLVDALRIVFTFHSKSISNLKTKDINNLNDNVEIIKQKAINDLLHLKKFDHSDKQALIGFIISIANDNNIKITKQDYKLQYNSHNIHERVFNNYIALIQYFSSKDMGYRMQYDALIFTINGIQYNLITYLILCNTLYTVKLGDNKTKYYTVVNKLLHKTNPNFWIQGFNKDLLVHDRVALYNNRDLNTIISKSDYCSTSIMDTNKTSIKDILNNSCGVYNTDSLIFEV